MTLQISTKKLIWLYPLGCILLSLPTLLNLEGLVNHQFKFYEELTGSLDSGLWALTWFLLMTLGYIALIKSLPLHFTKSVYFFYLLIVACFFATVPFGSTDVFYYIGAARDEIINMINPYSGGFYKIVTFITKGNYLNGQIMYPPLWLQINKIIWALSQAFGTLGQIYFYKLVFLVCHVMTALVISKTASSKLSIIYFLNPLLLFEFATNAHFDALMLLLIALAILSTKHQKVALTLILLTLAALTKYTAVLFAPFFALFLLLKKVYGQHATGAIDQRIGQFLLWLIPGLFFSTILVAASFLPYWTQVGLEVFRGISLQSDWFMNSLFSTIYIPIIWIYQTITLMIIPTVSAKYLWATLMLFGTLVIFYYLVHEKVVSKFKNLSLETVLELTTVAVLVFTIFFQRSFWPWYAAWPFLTGAYLGTKNKMFKLSLVLTLSSLTFYTIYSLFGYNSTQPLNSLQVLYGMVIFAPVIVYAVFALISRNSPQSL